MILTDDFNESIEYRPIIKYSTTTAVIDVEMRMIDAVDDSYIVRKASYGMLQDEVSKYSLRLSKINLKNAFKPKVYNIKNAINPSLIGKSNSMGMIDEFASSGGIGNVNFDGSDVEGGGKWGNRADDIICIHRYTSHSTDWMFSNLYILKVKENETGGRPTVHENPLKLRMKINNVGFEFLFVFKFEEV